jgi:WD40 repeat protein
MMLSGAGTRVLLVGTGTYASGSGLEPVAAVSSTLTDLGQVLVERCGVAPARLRVLRDPENPTQVGLALAEEAEQATEVLLFYYVGHGVISRGGQLYVATGATDRRPTRLTHTALAYPAVREALLASKARAVIVVLDCCFSGRAVETLGAGEIGEIADLAAVRGGYVLAAASREEMALAPAGQPHTAFTGELIRLLTDGDPLAPLQITLRHMFDYLERAALAHNFPLPQQRASGTITDLVLCTNPAYQPAHKQPAPLPEGNSPGDLCPYPGLAAFGPAQAQWFFGREDLCAELLRQLGRRMDQPGPVIVVGPSGSGKSSLLRAGLLPALAQGVLPVTGSRTWARLILTPTGDPLGELATKLAEAMGGCPPLPQNVADAPRWFTAAARGLLRERSRGADAGRARLVVVVDQLEELFTVCAQEPARQAFLDALCAAATGSADGESPVLVVLGVRADFYGRLAVYPALRPALQHAQLIVGPMSPTELGAAITKPAELVGLTLQPGLPELLLHDLGDTAATAGAGGMSGYEAGRLPLLAHALRATWDQRSDHTLTVAGYQATGGIHRAVATTAESVFTGLDPAGQHAARILFLRLIRIGDGTEDTRRRMIRDDLLRGLDSDSVLPVVDTFTRGRLLTQDQDTIEITHEALLRAWPRLRAWIDTDRAGNLIRQELEEAADVWDRDRRDTAGLYRGRRLELARTWATSNPHESDLSPTVSAFLAASTQQEQRAARLRRTVLVVLCVLALITSGAAVVAIQQRVTAQRERDTALFNQLTAEADRLRSTDASLAAQLDLTAYHLRPTPDLDTTLITLGNGALSTPLTGHTNFVEAVAYSLDGRTLASGSADRTVRLWNVADPAHPALLGQPLTGHTSAVTAVAFSPIGHTVATGSYDDTVRLWNVADPAHSTPWGQPLTGHTDTVFAVAFSPDGRTLASASADQTVRLWNVTDPAHPALLGTPLTGHTQPVFGVAFSPDGRTLASGSFDQTVRLWNVTDPVHPTLLGQPLTGHSDHVTAVAFSPDGHTLASGSSDRTVRLWNVTDPAHPTPLGPPLTGHTNLIFAVAFSPDGRTLASGSYDQTVRLWNVADPAHPIPLGSPLISHTQPVFAVAFSPDGHTLASASGDHTVRLWNIPYLLTTGHTGAVFAVAFSPDERTLASGGNDHTVRLWNVADPAHPTLLGPPLTGHATSIEDVAFSPDGHTLASASADHTVRLWNVTDPAQPTPLGPPLTGHTNSVSTVAFSPDGHTLASGSNDHTVRLWNVTDPAQPTPLGPPLTGHTNSVSTVAFSPDGHTLAGASGDDTVLLWNVTDPARPTPLGSPLTGHTNQVLGVAFSPDGHTLATGSNDQTVRLWSVTDPAHSTPLGSPLTGHTDTVSAVAFSPDGHTLATGSLDDTVRLWNVTDPAHSTPLGSPLTGHTGAVDSVAFSPDGHILATGSYDHTVRLWETNVDRAIQRICATTPNTLTPDKWKQYVSPDLPYHPPCE